MSDQSYISTPSTDPIGSFYNRYSGGRWIVFRNSEGLLDLYRKGTLDGNPYLYRRVTRAKTMEELPEYFTHRDEGGYDPNNETQLTIDAEP